MRKRFYGCCFGMLLALCVGCGSSASDVEQKMITAEKFYTEEQYDKAIDAYLEVLDLDSKNEDAYIGLIDVYIANGEYEAAENRIKEAGQLFESKKLDRRAEKLKEFVSEEIGNTLNEDHSVTTNTPTVIPPTEGDKDIAKVTPEPTATEKPFSNLIAAITSTDSQYFKYEIENGAVTITGLKEGYPSEIRIPEVLEGLPVTAIGKRAFYECNNLKSVSIPNSVTSIGGDAFWGTKWLEKKREENPYVVLNGILIDGTTASGDIVIPDGVTSIGEWAFYECNNLKSVSIPSGVTRIDGAAFFGCSNLETITIPSSVTDIGRNAFNRTKWLEKKSKENPYVIVNGILIAVGDVSGHIEIPNGVTTIGENAFGNCSSLTSINIPNSVTEIGEYAFSYCSSLTSINIPNSVTEIGKYAFAYCTSLTSVSLPSSVNSIEEGTFGACTSLTGISIPDSVTSIGDAAFGGCGSLININIPNSVISIGDFAFNQCRSLTSISIPSSVLSIGNSAFLLCTSLTDVNIRKRQI